MATATLYPDALETLNKWYEEGHVITFFTSRTEDHRDVTKNGSKRTVLSGMVCSWVNRAEETIIGWIITLFATRYTGKFTDLVEKRKYHSSFDD